MCVCDIKLRMGKADRVERRRGGGLGQRNHAFTAFKELSDFADNIFIAVHRFKEY